MPTALKSIGSITLALVLFQAPLQAQGTALNGSYSLVGNGGAEINRAIEQAIAKMSFVVRPIARGRLRRTNLPYATIQLGITSNQITIDTRNGNPITTPADGTPIEWKREDGEVLRVSTEWRNGALQQTFVADDGQRVNVYTLGAGGTTMELRVTVTSPRLPAPVTYTLRYRRER